MKPCTISKKPNCLLLIPENSPRRQVIHMMNGKPAIYEFFLSQWKFHCRKQDMTPWISIILDAKTVLQQIDRFENSNSIHLSVKIIWRLCQKLKVMEAISNSGCEATSSNACTISIDSSEPEYSCQFCLYISKNNYHILLCTPNFFGKSKKLHLEGTKKERNYRYQ